MLNDDTKNRIKSEEEILALINNALAENGLDKEGITPLMALAMAHEALAMGLDAAWDLISTAGDGDWSKASSVPGWREAAEHWRANYIEVISMMRRMSEDE